MGEHLGNSLFEYLMILEEEERRRKLKEIAKKKKKKQKQLAMQRAAQIVKETGVGASSTATGHAGNVPAPSNNLNSVTGFQSSKDHHNSGS